MMINNLRSVSNLYSPTQTRQTSRANSNANRVQNRDEFVISKSGQDFGELLGRLQSVSDVRQDRIDELSAQIENGTYHIDAEDIAASILNSRF